MNFEDLLIDEDEEEEEFDDTSYFRVNIKKKWNLINKICSQDESGLCNDLGFLAHLPELCDITFMVGPEKEPVCAVRAVLGKVQLVKHNPELLTS